MMVNSLGEINRTHIEEAVKTALTDSIESRGPLGYRTRSILLYGINGDERVNGVSINQHSYTIKMLITDKDGQFLFYGGFSVKMNTDFIIDRLFEVFSHVHELMDY